VNTKWLGPVVAFAGFGLLMWQKGMLTTLPGLALMGIGIFLVIRNRKRRVSKKAEVPNGPYIIKLLCKGEEVRRISTIFHSSDEIMKWYDNETDWEGVDEVKVLDLSKKGSLY